MKAYALLTLVGLLAVACTDEPDRQNTPMRQEVVTSSRCSNERALAVAHERPEESLTADIDGDGSADDVYLALDDGAEPGCRAFVVVDVGQRLLSAAVDPSGAPRALPEPSLRFAAPINDLSGAEVVVNIEAGASTEFVGVFTVVSKRLTRVQLEGAPPGPFAQELAGDALLPFGGSVGHMEAVDCADVDGSVVLSAAVPSGSAARVYEVERRFFRADGPVLKLVPDLTQKHTVRNLELGRFPEFTSSPFGSCE